MGKVATILFSLFMTEFSFAFLLQHRIAENSRRYYSRGDLRLNACDISEVERVYCISDLHTDNVQNLQWLKESCASPNAPKEKDCLLIAGDISHDYKILEKTLSIITESLSCHVIFVWGNHEAWCGLEMTSSLEKISSVKKICQKYPKVHTDFQLVGTDHSKPVVVVPIESWYDGSLSLPECEDLCENFQNWPWVDFIRCHWPSESELMADTKMVPSLERHENLGKIPIGLTEWFHYQNEKDIDKVRNHFEHSEGELGLITMTHFLPNQKTLPDWKVPSSTDFRRDEWLDHPVPDVSAKFAKVAGTKLIDDQIRSIINKQEKNKDIKHLHIFGHSHRPKDFVHENVRYIHNPVGKPVEREMNMIPNDVDFQLIWDCRSGEVHGKTIIRYWEDYGGGKELLAKNMQRRKRKRMNR